jgi:hypothetical protein
MAKKKSITHQQMDAMNWRYKKNKPPIDEFAHINGEVKVIKSSTLPNPFKCSKCDYIATSVKDSKQHWLDH